MSLEVSEAVSMTCGKCGIEFWVPSWWQQEKQNNGDGWYCPNGDSRVYKKSEAQKQKERADRLEAQLVHERDQREAAERRVARAKGEVTRVKNRVKNGVCPFCKRTFTNVERHMESKHKDEHA